MNKIFCLILVFLLAFHNQSYALNIIRDDEIEDAIMEIAKPILIAAGINKDRFKIYITDNETLNAYTAGGTEIFIHSKLITEFLDPNILQAVIAHEIGHVLEGHVIQQKENLERLRKASMITSLVGLIGGTVSGSFDVASGAIIGSNQMAQSKFLNFSRQHENEADQIALDLLRKANCSNHGLLTLFKTLMVNQRYRPNDQYFITHPLGQWRIDHVKEYNKKYKYNVIEFNHEQLFRFEKAVYKLRAFTYNIDKMLQEKMPNEFIKHYVKSIVFFRQGKKNDAENEIINLTNKFKNDAYLLELKGQIFFENGKFDKARIDFKDALKINQSSQLLQYQLAVAQINLANTKYSRDLYQDSVNILKSLINKNFDNVQTYYYLSIAYGKLGEIGKAKLALADKAFLMQKKDEAKKMAIQAREMLEKNSLEWEHASEIINN